ncbi:hypothetical protein KSS87_003199 [Heliosperma pusillum]|nr:hypothetical protein KSS87_003199 [Heliosperma pusillum]
MFTSSHFSHTFSFVGPLSSAQFFEKLSILFIHHPCIIKSTWKRSFGFIIRQGKWLHVIHLPRRRHSHFNFLLNYIIYLMNNLRGS